MKNKKLVLSLLMFLLMTTMAWGVSNITGKWQGYNSALIFDTDVTIDANALEMFIYNDGNFAYDNANVYGKTDGLYFPRGTKKTVIYAGGLWMAAKVGDEIRGAIAEFSSEFVPGPLNEATGTNFQDKGEYRVYKIRRGDDAASNPDYANWPADQGAPVDEDGNPAMVGDVMTWTVFNDGDLGKHTNTRTDPMGVEVQETVIAFARGGALGNVVFMRFKIINKGGNQLDSMFVSCWADPDLGDASDDLVGCDTLLSLGYCYNEGADDTYGAAPPAVGYDFFQGPIVPADPTDSALVEGQWIHGYKNLPMTSFNKYINGTDPDGIDDVWSYMNGLNRDGTDYENPDGIVTKFVHAGDPVTGEGDIDEASADRRWMMSSGPFDMAPGDTQEVVIAVLVGQGSNPLTSVSALKQVDVAAQAVFELNFDIPSPPPSPSVFVRGGDGFVDLAWGTEAIGDIQENENLGQEFHFEGYNVYQGESEVGPWHKIATYDEVDENGVSLIYWDVLDPVAGGSQRIVQQKGSDSGLEHHMKITTDQISGSSIKNNQPYFFAVTAYSYDYLNIEEFNDQGGNLLGYIAENLESPIISYEVRPKTHIGLFQVNAEHDGTSDGAVIVEYINPEEITGHDYEVTFSELPETTYVEHDEDIDTVVTMTPVWNLRDKTTNSMVLSNEKNQEPGYQFPVVDGFMIRVQGPSLGVKAVDEVHNGDGPVDPPDNLRFSLNSTKDWYIDPGGNHGFGRFIWQGATTNDYEIRFTDGATEHCFDWFGQGDYGQVAPFMVPIEFWDIGIGTVDDPSDDRRICFAIIDDDGSGSFSWGDGLYIWDIDYDDVNWNDPTDHAGNYDPDYNGLHYGRWWFYDNSGALTVPAPGTVVRTLTNKVNTPDDVFTFSTEKPSDGDGEFIANSLEDVKTVPNPYYAFYQEEVDQFDRIVKFINLPPVDMTIRIFNLAGDLIRTMDRTDINNPEFVWDLKTDNGLWVAPGVYVWLIESTELGTKYGKMAIFTETEQLNTF